MIDNIETIKNFENEICFVKSLDVVGGLQKRYQDTLFKNIFYSELSKLSKMFLIKELYN